MKIRSRVIAIIVAVLALLIVGTNAYGWVAEHRSLLLLTRQVTKLPTTAIFVPRQAPAVFSLLANPDDLAQLNRLLTPTAQQKSADRVVKAWERRLFRRLHLDFQREIVPWWGEEITIAVTSLDWDRDPKNGAEPGYLMILSSRHPELSNRKIQAWWDKQLAAEKLELSDYQGVKLAYNTKDKLASALVGNKYVLFANHPKILRESINNLQTSSLSIIDRADYQQVWATHNHHKIGIGYARLRELEPWLGKTPEPTERILGINLGVDRQGLIADAVIYPPNALGTGQINLPTSSSTTAIQSLHCLPRTSTIALSGKNLSDLKPQFTQLFANYDPLSPALDRGIDALSQNMGIDIRQEILRWVTGEYAIAAIPNPDQKRTDWVLVAERTQPQELDTAIAHLDELAAQRGYNVGLLPWEDHQVVGWTKLITATDFHSQGVAQLIAQVPGAHTTVEDKYTILASSVEAMDSTLKAIEQQSILDSDRYRRAAHLLTATETGYLYGNWNTIAPLIPLPIRKHEIFKLLSEGLLSGLPNISLSNSNTPAGLQIISLLLQKSH
jgi:hypothetical protein